jgi:cyclophilin family peptidyl-prolyl cis-trans isomerase
MILDNSHNLDNPHTIKGYIIQHALNYRKINQEDREQTGKKNKPNSNQIKTKHNLKRAHYV